jgi:uncharacterized protein (UPF0248 family)
VPLVVDEYPTSPPKVVIPGHLESLGLKEHVIGAIPADSEGSPILYCLIDAARQWVSDHPLSVQPRRPVVAKDNNNTPKVPICKYFLQGKCRFGEKCNNSHASGSSASKRTTTADQANHSDKKSKQEASTKPKRLQTKENTETGDGEKKAPMRTSEEVISRILWDPDLPSEEFKVGYLDRFLGIMEKPFSSFSWEDLATVGYNVLAVPKHRIQYFKYREEIVWDKRSQLDNVFGSRGGRLIQDIVGEQQEDENLKSEVNQSGLESKLIEVEVEEQDIITGSDSLSRVLIDRSRPTHFVCVRITDSNVQSKVSEIQGYITKYTPALAEACLPIPALHVTLCMVRLENDQHVATAQKVMENVRSRFIHVLPRSSHLTFTGVSDFHQRLVYAKVAPCLALDNFVFFLIEQFQEAGLATPGNHKEYTAHMTLVKLSRAMQRDPHTSMITPAIYEPFTDMEIGSNRIETMSLCSMIAQKQADGFYMRYCEVTNSLSGLPPHFLSALVKRVDSFSTSGVISEDEHDKLVTSIHAGSDRGKVKEFDSAIDEIISLGQEDTTCATLTEASQVPVVIAFRGVPGSGKSFLVTHCSEYLTDSASVAICSADFYFMRDGEYKYSTKLLPMAHTYCLDLFLQALAEGKQFIVVDNTHSRKWEYEIYSYISSILGCRYHVLEIPCPSQKTLETYRSRNQHKIDEKTALNIFKRWEVDEAALLVPPSLAYPRMISNTPPVYSLVSLCSPDELESSEALAQSTTLKAVYTAVFLTPESQWRLVSAVAPTIDEKTALNIFKRWEVDEAALLVPPSLAYPRMISNTPPVYSLVSLCSPDELESSEALAQSTTLKAVYTAVFLTPESQWRLVSAVAPTHPRISADHVTLVFEPGKESCLNANIGSRVSLCVTGTADNGQIQVATVELPRGLTCQNTVPHITVSAGENVPFKAANELLERQRPKPVYQNTELEGIIGIAVREKNGFDEPTECNSEQHYTAQQLFTIKSGMLFRGQIVPKLDATADDTDIDTVEICTGEQKATRLYLFDFDDTLFSTPDARTGRQLYENFTGRKWKRKGWFTWPESLLPPLKAVPGPVLATFRDHIGQAGSITAILTGRNERTKPGVDHVLECYGVYPEKLIMKPDDTDEGTPVFKARIVQQLLNEHPNITLVKFWDDNTRNLAAIHRLSLSSAFKHIQFDIVDATKMIQTTATKQGKKVKVQAQSSKKNLGVDSYPSTLESYLASCGYLSSPAYKSSADCGIRFIAEQFSKLVGYTGNPLHLVYPFGSFPLGRRGDVDLCLLCPPHLTPADALEELSRALSECGITYLHKGYSTRCPRLKLMLKFTAAPPIDYDIVFASISDPAHFESPQALQLPAPKVLSKIKPGDSVSKTAFTGAVLLHGLLEGINGVMPGSRFGGVVEVTVQMLIAQRQKGNAYHCIRTFHIVKLLATFIRSHRDTLTEKNSDMIFKEFAVYVTKLPDETWKKLFCEFVPYEFIPKVQKVFKRAAELMSSEQGGLCYQELMDKSAIYPPEGYTLVEIKLSGSNKIALWRLHAIVEARFPSYARQLISQGLDILPDGNVENKTKFVFAIMHTKATKQTLQQVLRPFWNEISRFKSEEGVNISLTFGRTADNSSSSENSHQEQPKESIPAIKELTKFVSDSTQFEMMISCPLTSYERMLVHEKCEQLGLNHATIVVRNEKHILVKKNQPF